LKNILFAAALLFAAAAHAGLPTVQLNAGMHLIHAEVAADMGSRMQGLMHRKSMATNSGMIFIFDEASQQCMWMKNTFIPLSVAFLDERGTILNIEDMKPQTEESHCSTGPARYALEMNQGWFVQRGIKAGTRLGGLEKLRR